MEGNSGLISKLRVIEDYRKQLYEIYRSVLFPLEIDDEKEKQKFKDK